MYFSITVIVGSSALYAKPKAKSENTKTTSQLKQTTCYQQRWEEYEKVVEEIKTNVHNRSDFENAIVEKIFRWWKDLFRLR